ncbi:MAG: hypothetical protein ACSHX8_12250 [Opitutaceae bacterium]
MDREEAKNILQLCRPGNESDLNDPLIAEAFEVLESDSELQIWFEDQQEFDTAFAAQMKAIEPPADLKASILVGMRAHHAQAAAEPESAIDFKAEAARHEATPQREPITQRSSSNWWRNPWVGIAALFVFMMIIIGVPRGGDDAQLAQNDPALAGLPAVLPFLSDQIDNMKSWGFDKRHKDVNQLQSYLASTGAPSPRKLCDKLANTPTLGCVTFEYEDAKLSMICFKDGEVYHLITADAAAFPAACPKQPAVYEIRDKAFKVWVDGDQLNILTIHGTKNDIPEFI